VDVLRTDVGGLRKDVDVLRTDVDGLRKDVGEVRKDIAVVRQDMSALEVRLVDRINQSESGLRQEIHALDVRMERGFGSLRSDVLKWSFAMWIGQVAAMTAIISVLLR
jgi:hypothetical protein